MADISILDIVLGVIAGVGGISGVIILGIKFSVNIITKRLEEKYTLKLSKELEKYKSNLNNTTYISKAKFDVEFAIYRELSKNFFEMVKDITIMIPSGYAKYPANKEECKEYENNLYKSACNSTIVAQDTLSGNIPFISQNFYEKYREILDLCFIQIDVFEERWNIFYLASQKEKETFDRDDYTRSREIKQKFEDLNKEIREYLKNLDTIE